VSITQRGFGGSQPLGRRSRGGCSALLSTPARTWSSPGPPRREASRQARGTIARSAAGGGGTKAHLAAAGYRSPQQRRRTTWTTQLLRALGGYLLVQTASRTPETTQLLRALGGYLPVQTASRTPETTQLHALGANRTEPNRALEPSPQTPISHPAQGAFGV